MPATRRFWYLLAYVVCTVSFIRRTCMLQIVLLPFTRSYGHECRSVCSARVVCNVKGEVHPIDDPSDQSVMPCIPSANLKSCEVPDIQVALFSGCVWTRPKLLTNAIRFLHIKSAHNSCARHPQRMAGDELGEMMVVKKKEEVMNKPTSDVLIRRGHRFTTRRDHVMASGTARGCSAQKFP